MHKCHPHLERHFCRLQIQWKVPPFEAHSIPSPTCASLRSIFLCCQLNMIIMNSRESDIKKVALNKNISRIALCSVSNGEGNGTPLQYSCLENPMGGGACQAVVHGVAKSRTRLSNFTLTFHFMHWRRQWQPTPVFLSGESQGWGSLVSCRLQGRTESDTTEVTQQQQQQSLTHVQLFATPWTVARQAPLSIGFPRQEYCNGLPFPSLGDLPDPEVKPLSPVLAGQFFTIEPPGELMSRITKN